MSKFLTGALLGLAAGLLLAPEKGEDTRESIADTAGNLKKKFDKLTGRAAGKLGALRDSLGEEIEGISDDVRQRILTILDEEDKKAEKSNGRFDAKEQFKPI